MNSLPLKVDNPDPMGGSKEAPPGPYKKAADDYCEHYSTIRRSKGTDISGEVYQVPHGRKYKHGYDNIKWNTDGDAD